MESSDSAIFPNGGGWELEILVWSDKGVAGVWLGVRLATIQLLHIVFIHYLKAQEYKHKLVRVWM